MAITFDTNKIFVIEYFPSHIIITGHTIQDE